MNRFIYYFIVVNMFANIVASVPRILISEMENGAITGITLAFFFSIMFIWFTVKIFSYFPGMGLPDLLDKYTSKWAAKILLVYFALNWYLAGLLSLITYVDLLLRFLTPEMSSYTVLSTFIAVVSLGIVMKSRSLLSAMEIIIIIFIPITLFFLIKMYVNESLLWDNIGVAFMHSLKLPSYTAFTSASYPFFGVVNIILFNAFFTKKLSFGRKEFLFIGAIGFFSLFTTFFIPIGFIGFDAIKNVVYPWIMTSDSVRMKFGVIERVIFVFLLIFLAIALLNIVIHWHISAELLNRAFNKKNYKVKNISIFRSAVLVLFWTVALYLTVKFTERDLFISTKVFFAQLPLFVVVFVGMMLYLKRRARIEKDL